MPVDLSVKNVPDSVAKRLRSRAEHNHRSLQGELMAILHDAVTSPAAAPAAGHRAGPPVEGRRSQSRRIAGASESALIIRKGREGRSFSIVDLHRFVTALGIGTPDEATAWIRQERSRR
jgi:plasmid stability protein